MKVLVLNSGGLDSTTCVGIAVDKYGAENVATLKAYYGQRNEREVACARAVAKHYGLRTYDLELTNVFEHSDCPLLAASSQTIEHSSYQTQTEQANGQGVSTYVPFRNGVFLSCAASFAMQLFPSEEVALYTGVHKDDIAGRAYADCAQDFIDHMDTAISIGTYERVSLEAPLVNMNKAEIVATGLMLGVPYELTWSCYENAEKPCGKCASCLCRLDAFAKNGATDPLEYMEA